MRSFSSMRGRREFTLALRRGSSAATNALVVHVFSPRSKSTRPKVGIIVTKRVGKAVVRNKVRRRCKAIMESLLERSTGRWYVVACKPASSQATFEQLRSQLAEAIAQASSARTVRGKP